MKSARRYWTGAIVVVLAVVAVYAVSSWLKPRNTKYESTDAFLAEIRKTAEKEGDKGTETGFIPGTSESQGTPNIVLDKTTLDLGVVPNTHTTVVDFPIKNTGKGILVISDVGTSCHCTEGAMAEGQNIINPGGQGILKVSLHPDRVPDGFGSHKQLTIHCNDPQHPMVTLDVISKIDPEFSITPDTLAFGDIPKGKAVTKVIRVRQISSEPFEVKKIIPAHPEDEKKFELSFEKLPASEWEKPDRVEYDVKVTLPATLSVGGLSSGIKIQNTCARQNVRDLWVPVSANVVAFYRLSTPKLVIPATGVTPGKADIGSLTVDADQPFELSDLNVSDPLLTVSAKAGAKPNSQVLTIGLSALATPGVKNGDIHFTIAANGESYSESVPVQVIVPSVPR